MHFPVLVSFVIQKLKYGCNFMTFCLYFQRRAVPLRSTYTFMIEHSKKLPRRTKLRLNVVLAHEHNMLFIWNRKEIVIKIMLPVRTVGKTVTRCPVLLTVKKEFSKFFLPFCFSIVLSSKYSFYCSETLFVY